ncbi:hypothetical protein ACFVS2_26220 [Brevibacillus sp. NPDC058079]|uniref:hypothetical protein n=1 Tax=Brevibacillus sp. NPDC058079 TaxID=3346330 RepID=UPI0036E3F124
MRYFFELEHNESIESERFGSGEFEWTKGTPIIEADSFEQAVQLFFEMYREQLNEILDWETDGEDAESGYVSYSNSVDGCTLGFRVT